MHPANKRSRYIVTYSLIGWAHTQNDPVNAGFNTIKYREISNISLTLIDNMIADHSDVVDFNILRKDNCKPRREAFKV